MMALVGCLQIGQNGVIENARIYYTHHCISRDLGQVLFC